MAILRLFATVRQWHSDSEKIHTGVLEESSVFHPPTRSQPDAKTMHVLQTQAWKEQTATLGNTLLINSHLLSLSKEMILLLPKESMNRGIIVELQQH